MRTLIVNQHTHNVGDEAAGVALVQMLLASGVVERIDIVYHGPDRIPIDDPRVNRAEGVELKEVGALSLALYLIFRWGGLGSGADALRRFRELVHAADVVLVAPSGANIGIYRDWRFLVRVLLVVLQGVQPIFHWNTIGRSGDWLFDRVARFVLRRSRLYVREEASRVYLEELKLPCVTGPDTAFALEPVSAKVRADVLCLIPSELDSWHPEFRGVGANRLLLGPIISSIASFAVANDLRVEILPHLRTEGERVFNGRVRDELLASGMAPEAVLTGVISSFYDYDIAIASSRFVVGGRYHSVILAGKNFRPFVALSYENKMKEACRYMGMSDFCVDLHHVETAGEEVARCLERLLAEEKTLSMSLESVVSDQLRPVVGVPLRELGVPVARVSNGLE